MSYLTHDDGSLNGKPEVLQGVAYNSNDSLHAVNLLPQEDVHGSNGAHLLESGLDFVGDVVGW